MHKELHLTLFFLYFINIFTLELDSFYIYTVLMFFSVCISELINIIIYLYLPKGFYIQKDNENTQFIIKDINQTHI